MAYNLVFTYTANGKPFSLVIINTGTGEGRTVSVASAPFFPKTAVPHDGKLYFNANAALYVYDPSDGSATLLGTASNTLYAGTVAPDGVLFYGTYPEGRLIEYDPATDTFTDHGRMDADGPNQYVYSIGADADYVYCGMGQDPWYLAVYNRATGDKTLYFKDEPGGTRHVERGVDGTLWYSSYKLIGGEPVSGQTKPGMLPWYWQSGANIELTSWPDEIGYEVNLDDANPLTDKNAVIRWRQVGAEDWNTYEPAELPMNALVIHRLYRFDDTRLLGITREYGPVFLYDVETHELEVLGWPQYSLYDAVAIGGKWYFVGYPAATLEYNPAQPWTLTDSSHDETTTNPRKIFPVDKYHHYCVAGSDGRLYIAATHERDSVGGELGWYDPATEEGDTLRDPLARWNPVGLAAVGTKIVYAGSSLDGLDGTLFVFDVSDPTTVEREIVPLPDLEYTSPGYIIAVSATDVVGIAGTVAYRWNVVDDEQVWRIALPAQAMGNILTVNRRAEIAPDGMIYFYAGSAIYRLNPDDGALEKVLADATQGQIMWHGDTGFIYGAAQLRRLTLA